MKEVDFANHYVRALRTALTRGTLDDLTEAAVNVVLFLERRLTQRAKVGCHHCGEGEVGEPCLWCGLARTTDSERAQDVDATQAQR